MANNKLVALTLVLAATAAHAFRIRSMEDFWAFERVFKNATGTSYSSMLTLELETDLDFKDKQLTLPLGCEKEGECITWTGTLNGNGHIIRNLKMEKLGKCALFYSISDATIANLTFDSSCSMNGNDEAAMVAVTATDSNLENIRNYGTVTAPTAGGLCASFESTSTDNTVTNCHNHGTITSTGKYAGGLFATCTGTIDQSSHYSSYYYVTLRECTNEGKVTMQDSDNKEPAVGGLVGQVQKYTRLEKCVNKGAIEAVGRVGGLAGECVSGTITLDDCNNTGSVRGADTDTAALKVGGLVGYFTSAGTIERCHNTGAVTGTVGKTGSAVPGVAGLVGSAGGGATFDRCANTGAITATSTLKDDPTYVAGLVAVAVSGVTVKDCMNNGKVELTKNNNGYAFGLGPSLPDGIDATITIKNSVNTGEVTGQTALGISVKAPAVDNVVNIGKISGTDHTFQTFDGECEDNCAHVHFFDSECSHKEQGMKLVDGVYRSCDGNIKVVTMLNLHEEAEDYNAVWLDNLHLKFELGCSGCSTNAPHFVLAAVALLALVRKLQMA